MSAQSRPGHRARPQARARGLHGSPETHTLGVGSARGRGGGRMPGGGASGRGSVPKGAGDLAPAAGTGRGDATGTCERLEEPFTVSAHEQAAGGWAWFEAPQTHHRARRGRPTRRVVARG